MNDQERLGEIKKHWCEYTLKGMDIDWLIQQAEEKQELEKHIEVTDWELAGEKAQNKRYEETIKQAISYFNQDEHREGMKELKAALKGAQGDHESPF